MPTYSIKQSLEEEEERNVWKLPVILRMSAICCQGPGDVEPNCEMCNSSNIADDVAPDFFVGGGVCVCVRARM